MHAFTDEGRRTSRTPCLSTGGKHETDATMAAQDTFFCRRCGAIPRDSIWYDLEETSGQEDRPLPRVRGQGHREAQRRHL